MHGNRRVWNWTPWQWRSQGGGAFGPCPPMANHRGPTYLLPPKPKPGLLDPLGPLAEVDFYQVSGPRGTDRAPQEESGLYRTNPGPAGWTCKTNQGPARQIGAPQDRSGPVRRIKALRDKSGTTERIRASQYESGPRRTDQDPERRIRTRKTDQGPRDKQGPARRMRAGRTKQGPAGRIGPRWTKEGPVRRIRAPREESGPRRINQNKQDVPGPRKTNQAPAGRIRALVRKLFSRSPRRNVGDLSADFADLEDQFQNVCVTYPGSKIFICGDLNCCLFKPDSDPAKRLLCDFMSDHSLSQCVSSPTYSTGSMLDVFITNCRNVVKFCRAKFCHF